MVPQIVCEAFVGIILKLYEGVMALIKKIKTGLMSTTRSKIERYYVNRL